MFPIAKKLIGNNMFSLVGNMFPILGKMISETKICISTSRNYVGKTVLQAKVECFQ